MLLYSKVRWENRLSDDRGKTAKICVDGVDCRIQNKKGTRWYSHKYNSAGLRYELATNIQTGDIVWFSGPHLPGLFNDIQIFRMGLKAKLEEVGEKCEADGGYRGEKGTIRHPYVFISKDDLLAKKRARARHETVNRRVKQYDCLTKTFRHKEVAKHKHMFRACVVLTQISFNLGDKPFQCKY